MAEDREPGQRHTSPPSLEPPSPSQVTIRMAIAVFVGSCPMLVFAWVPIIGPISVGFVAGEITADTKRGFIVGFLSGLAGVNLTCFVFPLLSSMSRIADIHAFLLENMAVYLVVGIVIATLGAVGGALGGRVREGQVK